MAVKSWNDHIEVVTEGGVAYAKVHEELTVMSWAELAEHDCSNYLQGSIAYNIPESKIAVWSGRAPGYWFVKDGDPFPGLYSDGGVFFYYYTSSPDDKYLFHEGYSLGVSQGGTLTILASPSYPLDESDLLVTSCESSDTSIFTVTDANPGAGYSARLNAVSIGTANLTISVPGKGVSITIEIEVE